MINVGKLTYILIQGFVVGAGPCVLICAPILLPYLVSTKNTWQEGLRATLVFGLTRLLVYTFLGGMVGYVGYYLFQLFYSQFWRKMLWGFAGIFIFILGLLIFLGKKMENPLCRYLQEHTLESSTKSMVILGVVVGLSPCLPLLAILTEIMFISEKFYQGFLYGLAFGLGTVISPLLLLGASAPLVKKSRALEIICAVLLMGMGLYIVWR